MPSAIRRHRSLLPVPGVALGAAAAKIKKWDRNDVLLVVCEPGTVAAGVFTQNRFCAAPVTVCREHLARSTHRSCFARCRQRGQRQRRHRRRGPRRRARRMRGGRAASRLRARGSAAVFDRRDHGAAAGRAHRRRACPPRAAAARADGWFAAANAIMTTDTVPKGASRRVDVDGVAVTVTGIAKGAGMIHPEHGDDARVHGHRRADRGAACCAQIAREVADVSFNGATVDGDTSTNDSFVLAATRPRCRSPPITSADRSAPSRRSARRSRSARSSWRRRSCATAKARPSSSRSASKAAQTCDECRASRSASRTRRS